MCGDELVKEVPVLGACLQVSYPSLCDSKSVQKKYKFLLCKLEKAMLLGMHSLRARCI
jgi:hypothetical protein